MNRRQLLYVFALGGLAVTGCLDLRDTRRCSDPLADKNNCDPDVDSNPVDAGDSSHPPGNQNPDSPPAHDGGTRSEAAGAVEAPPAPPATNLRRLTVVLAGPGEILVDEQPMPCAGTCFVDRAPGTPVTLAARQGMVGTKPISVFLGWSGACTGKGGCVVTLDGNKTLNANFHRFLAWEEEPISMAMPRARFSISPVGQDLYVSGEFPGTLGLAGRSFTSAGSTDGIVVRYGADGRVVWAKTIAGPAHVFVGLVVPGLVAGELRLAVSGGGGSSFGMQTLDVGPLKLTLNASGELLRSVSVPAASPYYLILGPFEPSPFSNGFVQVANEDNMSALVRIDESGIVAWSKVAEGIGNWFAARMCDSAGNVVALRGLRGTITIAGATFDGTSGSTLLVKLSPQGEYLWATALSVETIGGDQSATTFCDLAGDAYVVTDFRNEMKVGSFRARALEGESNVAIAKVRGATPQPLWLTSIGSPYDDSAGPWAFDAGGKLLLAPKFNGDVTIAGEPLGKGRAVIRFDTATGSALSAFAPGREITVMAPHPTAGAYFAGPDAFGQLTPPP